MIFLLRAAKHRLLWGWITAMLLAAGPLAADQIRTLDISAGGWRASAGAAAVRPAREEAGVRLTCPFRGQTQRVFWDRTLNLDLRPYALLEVEFSCAQPEALRSLGIYLKSGAGWYLWLPRPTAAGRQTITLALDDAATEGKPKGWQSISGLRLSCTKAASINTEVVLHALRLRTCEIVIVRADDSLPNAAEGRAARSATARLSRWLNEIGLAHTIISDAQVASGALQTARVVILPYNPHPPRRELRALETFLKRGGRLLVFYAAEPRLAKMMGMTLGDYQAAKQVGQWSSFAFNQQAPAHVPPVVFQDSGNIRPVRPAAKGARVIATWRNQAGRTQKEPAWVQSQQGLWMAHILLDGDDANKKQMLLALLGELHPPAWQTAAAAAWNKSGRIASFQNLPETLAGIRRARTGKISAALVQQALAQDEELRIHVAQRRYPQIVQKAAELKATLLQLYASAQQPRTPEFRGVWNHSGCGLYPGDWNRTCKLLAEAGLTAVFPNLAWAGAAHYPSKLVPATQTARTYGDQLQQSVAAAHRHGLELHAWKICWNLGPAPQSLIDQLKRANRLQQTDQQETLNWLCPSHPENIAQELKLITELIEHAPLDGLQLDYLRYPNAQACFCPGCRQRFEKWLGRRARNWPASASSGELKGAFQTWRTAQITDFLRATQRLIRQHKGNLKLSVAVYGVYPPSIANIGQDWGLWLKEGLVDFVCPMDYNENLATFAELVRQQSKLPQARNRLYPGIGVTAAESRLAPDQVIEQILKVREVGAGGFMLFDLTRTLEKDTLPLLSLGVTGRE